MRDVVREALLKKANCSPYEVDLQWCPAQSQVNCDTNAYMQNKIPCHSIEKNYGKDGAISAVLLLDLAAFPFPHTLVGSIDFSWDIEVEWLVHAGGARVLRRGQLLMMPLHMLILKVRIENLGIAENANDLVVCLASVNQFVTSLRLEATDETNGIPE